ncbi:MAG: 2-keto-4-pentenoate hydratase [Clostridiales bacterium]|jgi:2-keto-4-pentenoate hydratase|nr:2-keto-4-pentenoate hydratase [Clostridiales bacterium]
MESRDIQKYADLLYESERDKKPVKPLSEMDSFTLDDAYAVQLANISRVTEMGYTVSGKKIGLTSPGIQKQLGVNEPDYGHLFEAMECPNNIVSADDLILPKIEAELAFILSADLAGGNVTEEDVINATEYVVGAFEIVDSRVADWKIKLVDTVADNASSGRYILGTKKLAPKDIDLTAETMSLYKNGAKVEEGSSAAVLGNPCKAVAWLANRLWGYGVTLKKGEVILSGAFSAAPPAQKGDTFRVEFSSLGVVEAVFE